MLFYIKEYKTTHNLSAVRNIQESIMNFYRKDISQYCANSDKLHIKETYDLIPSELNNPNKRFVLKQLNKHARFREFEEAFIWLENAGVSLATYNISEPVSPLLPSKQRNLFKLFYSDVGMLMSTYSKGASLKVLDGGKDVNCGSMFENVAAQEFTAHGFNLYYYNNKKRGELDFVLETNDGEILPIEIKSGKDYKRHRALGNILDVENYHFKKAYVFGADNIYEKNGIIYAPIYFISALIND